MKLISLSAVGVVLAETGPRSKLTSTYGSKAMIKREKRSRKSYGEIGSTMKARRDNSLCSLRSNDPRLQCCDGIDIDCFGCNGLLLDQGQQCDDQPTKNYEQANYRDCWCDAACMLFENCCDDHAVTCRRLYPGASTTTSTTSTTTSTTTTSATTSTTSTTSTSTTMETSITTSITPAASDVNTAPLTLMDNLEMVFEKNRVRGRPHLERKWMKITKKWYKRHQKMTQASCIFENRSFEMNFSDPTDSCQVNELFDLICTLRFFIRRFSQSLFSHYSNFIQSINEATDALYSWGEYYTIDCNKVQRATDDKWFKRNEIKLENLNARSLSRMKC